MQYWRIHPYRTRPPCPSRRNVEWNGTKPTLRWKSRCRLSLWRWMLRLKRSKDHGDDEGSQSLTRWGPTVSPQLPRCPSARAKFRHQSPKFYAELYFVESDFVAVKACEFISQVIGFSSEIDRNRITTVPVRFPKRATTRIVTNISQWCSGST